MSQTCTPEELARESKVKNTWIIIGATAIMIGVILVIVAIWLAWKVWHPQCDPCECVISKKDLLDVDNANKVLASFKSSIEKAAALPSACVNLKVSSATTCPQAAAPIDIQGLRAKLAAAAKPGLAAGVAASPARAR
jgi:hypothetical protein